MWYPLISAILVKGNICKTNQSFSGSIEFENLKYDQPLTDCLYLHVFKLQMQICTRFLCSNIHIERSDLKILKDYIFNR